jgi:hypothetical protein
MEPPGTKNGITERERKMDVKITIIGTEKALNVWTIATATVNGKRFKIQMVRFDEPSRFGIRNGRISKLWAREENGAETIAYDRGWSHRPTTAEGKALLKEIVKQFN